MRLILKSLFILFSLLTVHSAISQTIQQQKESETYQIGVMVETLQQALKVRDEQALQTIQLYGTDSRYYSMIRGWLFQELVAVESQLYASKNKPNSEKFQLKSNFLKQAIRLIDLE
ncbi:hypothetical protein GCM10007916_09330 [Psychromonas marina]|uniref:Uncharacterized protein n=1 Tax=Psychromonas marina TaxID=88364 RepID=A0ABQ6DYP2_9GAMM|nr:hypothetical protein [Psychromonas marina]GLS89866.1 hypothetical protein GCM10007916_09330 [Psychromonas marina]